MNWSVTESFSKVQRTAEASYMQEIPCMGTLNSRCGKIENWNPDYTGEPWVLRCHSCGMSVSRRCIKEMEQTQERTKCIVVINARRMEWPKLIIQNIVLQNLEFILQSFNLAMVHYFSITSLFVTLRMINYILIHSVLEVCNSHFILILCGKVVTAQNLPWISEEILNF